MENFLELSLCLIEFTIVYFFGYRLFKSRYKYTCASLTGFALIGTVLLFLFGDLSVAIKNIGLFVWLTASFSLLFRDKLYIKVAFILLYQYILSIIDIITGNFFSLIFGERFTEVFYRSFANRLILCLFIKALNFMIIYLIYKLMRQSIVSTRRKEWLQFDGISLVFVIISVLFMEFYMETTQSRLNTVLFFILSTAFFALSMMITYFFSAICIGIQREKRLYFLEYNNSLLEQQIALQNQSAERLNKLRHDIKNHIIGVAALYKNGNNADAAQMLNELSMSLENTATQLSNTTGNVTIDTILACKAAVCENKNIFFKCHVETVSKIDIKPIDVSSVIGNILDNAIEAAEQCENPQIKIQIFIYKKYLTIISENSFAQSPMLVGEHLKTTKANTEMHGYGTEIIKEICDRYNGKYQWEINGNIFKSIAIMEV